MDSVIYPVDRVMHHFNSWDLGLHWLCIILVLKAIGEAAYGCRRHIQSNFFNKTGEDVLLYTLRC